MLPSPSYPSQGAQYYLGAPSRHLLLGSFTEKDGKGAAWPTQLVDALLDNFLVPLPRAQSCPMHCRRRIMPSAGRPLRSRSRKLGGTECTELFHGRGRIHHFMQSDWHYWFRTVSSRCL
jgi:hypothetical protein